MICTCMNCVTEANYTIDKLPGTFKCVDCGDQNVIGIRSETCIRDDINEDRSIIVKLRSEKDILECELDVATETISE